MRDLYKTLLTIRLPIARLDIVLSMRVIGLTGGIGSGKSTVARLLSEMGAEIIDADEIGHEVLESESQARGQVLAAFGHSILGADGSIDRRKLGKLVFSDRAALSRLNRIMHPRIFRLVKARLEQYRQQDADLVVIEAPLLIEAGWVTIVDRVWVITADRDIILARLEKAGVPREEAMARIRSQLPDKERLKRADVTINNDYGLEELKQKIANLWWDMQFDT